MTSLPFSCVTPAPSIKEATKQRTLHHAPRSTQKPLLFNAAMLQ
jgi:hypothetical protein